MESFGFIGSHVLVFQKSAYEFFDLLLKTLHGVFRPPYRWKNFLQQMVFVVYQSVPIIIFCVSFAAIVTIIESSFHMKMIVKNDSMVPGFAAVLILRELGVVVSALLLTSRVGAGMAAEVGTMKITEQIDALKMLGLNPIHFLVVPRFLACVFGGIILSLIANMVCLMGAMLVSQVSLGYSMGAFLTSMRAFVTFKDLVLACLKGAFFGAAIPLFSCYYGFECKAGAEGVGIATTKSVVSTSVAIIFLDFILTFIFSLIFY